MISNGWLDAFSPWLKIIMANLHDRGVYVAREVTEQLKRKFPTIYEGYPLKKIKVIRPASSSMVYPQRPLCSNMNFKHGPMCCKNNLSSFRPAVPWAKGRSYVSWVKPAVT